MKNINMGKKASWLVALPCCFHLSTAMAQTAIQWENVANATTSGGTITKNAGCDGCGDAGGNSTQQLSSDGYVEFNVTNNGGLYYAGLTNDYSGNDYNTIDHAVRIQGSSLEIRENGTWKADTTVAVNDVVRIEIENGDVVYYKNGTAIYASLTAPNFPVRFDVSLVSMGTSVANATGATTGGGGGGTVCGLNDSITHVPADYTNFAPPAQGARKKDPVFDCYIRRVTQSASGTATYHEYSSINPFNADNTRVLVESDTGLPQVVNLQGTVLFTGVAGEYVWHLSNPNIIYSQPSSTPIVRKHDLSTSPPTTTDIYDFSSIYDDIDFGGGEADISDDGNYIVIAGSP